MKDGFWNKSNGRQAHWRRRWLRTRRLRIDGEPEQKARCGGHQRALLAQRDLVKQLTSFGQHPLTGPVALDVCFYARRAQPPGLHRLAKHLLDVLGALHLDAVIPGRRCVLYRDDRQVKLLHVRLWAPQPGIDTPTTAHTSVTARPLRDVIADLMLCQSIEEETSDDGCLHEEDNSISVPSIRDIDPDPFFDPRHAQSLEQAEDWRMLNARLAAFDHRTMQQESLASTDALLTRMLYAAPTWIAGARSPKRQNTANPDLHHAYAELDRVLAENREMLLSGPISLALPTLPRTGGEGNTFKSAILQAVKEIAVRQPNITPLRVPLKVVLLVIPPTQGKDLDNLALAVLPVVQQVFAPPEIPAYEVIELARTPGDQPEGRLRLALGDGLDPLSTWERATAYVERHIERC